LPHSRPATTRRLSSAFSPPYPLPIHTVEPLLVLQRFNGVYPDGIGRGDCAVPFVFRRASGSWAKTTSYESNTHKGSDGSMLGIAGLGPGVRPECQESGGNGKSLYFNGLLLILAPFGPEP